MLQDEPGVPSRSLRLGAGTHTWAIYITICSVEFPREERLEKKADNPSITTPRAYEGNLQTRHVSGGGQMPWICSMHGAGATGF